MAGLIYISEEQSWSVAGWVFDHVVRQSAPHISEANRRLLSAVKTSMVVGVGYLDLSVLTPADKRVFLHALRSGLRSTEEGGSGAFDPPTFYPGFIDRFRELIDMLATDLNGSAEGSNKGEI